ncbi:MAG: ferritin-like domain-containing protein [Vicinamibacterales bacterium]
MTNQQLRSALTASVLELYGGERRQARVLAHLAGAASSRALREALVSHRHETAHQARRLARVVAALGVPMREACGPGLLGILAECREAIADHADAGARDAAIIATAQRLDYYEMAAYGTAAAWADALGLGEVAALLNQCLDEEVATADDLLAVSLTREHLLAQPYAQPQATEA